MTTSQFVYSKAGSEGAAVGRDGWGTIQKGKEGREGGRRKERRWTEGEGGRKEGSERERERERERRAGE